MATLFALCPPSFTFPTGGFFSRCIPVPGNWKTMAEASSQLPGQPVSDTDTAQYWCYHCDKRVSIETLANVPDIICGECKHGFVESIPSTSCPPSAPPSGSSDHADDPYFRSQFIQVLRLIAQSARDDDASPPPPPIRSPDHDYLRIELGHGWGNDEEDDDDDDDDDGLEFHNEGEEHEANEGQEDRMAGEDPRINEEDRPGNEDPHIDEEDLWLRLRIGDLAPRTRSMRSGVLDWAEILMGLEDNSIEFRLQVPESERYIGNPEDYVDAAEYEALLQTLTESDGGGRRGAPPASKSAVETLPTVEIVSEKEALVCAICKDLVGVGDMAKRLPCEHQYHEDCIVPWLGSRNSCPVCRFELPTDDQEYEEERKKRLTATATASGASGSGATDSQSG